MIREKEERRVKKERRKRVFSPLVEERESIEEWEIRFPLFIRIKAGNTGKDFYSFQKFREFVMRKEREKIEKIEIMRRGYYIRGNFIPSSMRIFSFHKLRRDWFLELFIMLKKERILYKKDKK